MPNRIKVLGIGFVVAMVVLAACSSPITLPVGPTPIPTLIPAPMLLIGFEPVEAPPLVVESYPAGLPSAADGNTLYNEHCTSCHGEDGKGLLPNARDFGDVDYMRGETPAEFYTVITEGRGDEMPAFGEVLSSDERWDVVFYVWRFSTDEEALVHGREIYVSSCIACHGEDGQSMILGAANFSDPRFTSLQSPSDFYVAVTQGRGSMPAWQARLSQDDRWAVIDYLRAFNYDPQLVDDLALAELETDIAEVEGPDCSAYEELTNPFTWTDTEAVAAGEELFVNCAGCHGEDGTGEIPGVPDFTNPMVRNALLEDADKFLCSTAEGLNAMFGWKDVLTTEQMWQVLTYIASLSE
ncbi:MAG: c-type cytochrome [Candidatus Promineifilaceae bacterium]